MTVIWGLCFVIMAALSVKGAEEDLPLKMTCPSIPQADASETYCTVNITGMINKTECVHQGKYIKISDSVRGHYNWEITTKCSIDVFTGECLHDPMYCTHCHTTGGVETETRVYLKISNPNPDYESKTVRCMADCRPKKLLVSLPCSLVPSTLALVTTKGTQDPNEVVRTVCPSSVAKFPVSLGCRLSFGRLQAMGCMGHHSHPEVYVSQVLELGTDTTRQPQKIATCVIGPFFDTKCVVFRGKKCWCNRKKLADRNLREVFFDHGVDLAQHGSFNARCLVHCPKHNVISKSFCRTTFTMPAYPYEVSAPKENATLEMLCPSLIPQMVFTAFCKVDVARLEEDSCFKSGVGQHKVVMSRFLNNSRTPVDSVTCIIANIPDVPHLCYTTPQCPFCRQQGEDQFLISLPYRRSVGSVHETFSCSTGCYDFDVVSNECGAIFTPEHGHK